AVLYQNQEELPNELEFDFIIAGGGLAGSVVAFRLGEVPNWKILVVGAGPSNEEIFNTRVPGLWYTLMGSSIDWNYTVVPQKGLEGRSLLYSRAKVLGDTMLYTRGSRDDWDRWAEMTGGDWLKWKNVLPYILKDNHYDPTVHSRDGKVAVSAPYTPHPFNDMLLQSVNELSEEFPFDLDYNDGRPIGIGKLSLIYSWKQSTVDHRGERSSAATTYLSMTDDNVHVPLNTHVTQLVQNDSTWDVKFKTLTAKKEVIVSGGSIGTPHILLNSGIGDSKELEAIGIKTILDSPSVGKNLSDHIGSFDLKGALDHWKTNRTGPLTQPQPIAQIAFTRLPANTSLFKDGGVQDPAPGMNAPHIEIAVDSISQALEVFSINLHPVSRGFVTLNTSDPFSYPVVDFSLLSSQLDVSIIREGIRSARRLFSSPTFTSNNSVSGTVNPLPNVTSNADLDAYIRKNAIPLLHAVGTTSMSPRNATWGVVDPEFRVKGTMGLRVVDASVVPTVPSAHTQAPVYGIAERASTFIVVDWKTRA
ncbi:Glucose dehydrogenase [FAD, quinone], partial [Leucoagaricus sp. SymC.cos]